LSNCEQPRVLVDRQGDEWLVTGRDQLYNTDVGIFSRRHVEGIWGPLRARVPQSQKPDADEVNHPSHYTWLPNGVEVIDITSAFSFVRGNALKYLLRADHKGQQLQDLKKARWYIDYEITQIEKEVA
jgi:hypothetical protein